MRLERTGARDDWQARAEAAGFDWHTLFGAPYWDETGAYSFTLDEVETRIERPATELHAMCREAVDAILGSEELLDRLAIPPASRDWIAASWRAGEPELYGRFDLAYGGLRHGDGQAKLLEYNADTPTSLYESTSFQWDWLEDAMGRGLIPPSCDQFNDMHGALAARLGAILPPGTDIHFAAFADEPEDLATVETLAWAAREAGMGAHLVEVSAIGLTDRGQFADGEGRVIGTLFKLYPWEDMLRDRFAPHLPRSGCRFIEPPWKACLSNKGLLPVLWRLFEGHPNLLPAFFADEVEAEAGPEARARVARAAEALARGRVTKPLFSREGASVTLRPAGEAPVAAADRAYDAHPLIVQAYAALPEFDGSFPVLGAWVVGRACVGLGIREDASRITTNMSRFRPHYILG